MLSASCGTKAACSAANCAAGCCDDTGTCQLAQTIAACGTSGFSCKTCALGQNCLIGSCVTSQGGTGGGNGGTGGGFVGTGGGAQTNDGGMCNQSNCLGCCTNGFCVPPPNNTSSQFCGTNGQACNNCGASGAACNGQTFSCVGGTGGGSAGTGGGSSGTGGGTSAVCNPSNCGGCCRSDGFCVSPPNNQTSSVCGAGGSTCANCSALGTTCDTENGVCRTLTACNASNCPVGCCLDGVCTDGHVFTACGTGGVTCASCQTGQSCSTGSCQTTSATCRAVSVANFTSPLAQGYAGSPLTFNYHYARLGNSSSSGFSAIGYEAVYSAGFPTNIPPTTRPFTDAGYNDCQACAYYVEGCSGAPNANVDSLACTKSYLAWSGTLNVVTATKNADAGTFAGNANTIRLVRWDFANDQPLAPNDCVDIAAGTFNAHWP